MRYLGSIIFLSLVWMWTVVLAHPGEEIKSIKAPYSCPTGLTFDGENLWVADHKADQLVCVDPETGTVLKEILSPGFWPMGLAWDGKCLWNIDEKQKKIYQVDPADGTILKVIDAPCDHPQGLAWDGKTLWVSDPRKDAIMKIDLWDGTAVQTFPSPAKNVHGLTFDGRYLWCSDRILDEIHMINPQTGEVIVVLDSPGPYPRGLAWDGEHLWNVDYQTDQLYQLVREDDELYKLDEPRKARVTLTHEVKVYGQGQLRNLNVYLAIPGSLPQQQILSKKFSPESYIIIYDQWQQAVAHFQYQNLQAPARLLSTMSVEAEISAIHHFIYPERCGTLKDIPAEIRKSYTVGGSKYGIEDPYIQGLAHEIVGGEENPYWMARKIFDYVRSTLEYELVGGWNIASVVLKRGTGSCSEYTFSFIALCRAAGLPARYVGSIVVRGDDASLDETFHRWPEVYLPHYGWIPIDPQGGDKPLPRDRAMNIGYLSNRLLITMQGGGDSEYLGWSYNSYETYQTDPQTQVNVEIFGEWEPLESEE